MSQRCTQGMWRHIWDLQVSCWISYPKEKAYGKNAIIINVKINLNLYVCSLISHRVQQTSQFTPLALELSLIWSHLLWGEFSVFSAANAIHNSPFYVPPGTHHCWVDRGGMIWEACPTPTHGLQRDSSTGHPSTNRAQRCLIIQWSDENWLLHGHVLTSLAHILDYKF